MNPFELAAHLTDGHWYSPDFVDDLDNDEAKQLHYEEHAGIPWAHNHDTKTA